MVGLHVLGDTWLAISQGVKPDNIALNDFSNLQMKSWDSFQVVASPICHTHLQESSDLVLIGSNSTGSYRLTGSQIDSADTGLCMSYMADWFCSRCRIYACYLAVALTQDALHCPSWPFFCASQEVPVGSIAYFFIFIYSFHASVFLCIVCVLYAKSITADNRTVTLTFRSCVKYWRDPFPSRQDLLHCRFSVDVQTATGDESISVRYTYSCSAFHKLHCF